MTRARTRFETKLSELEAIAQKMEQGELGLEDALKYFEKGVKLARECQAVLKTAEQTIQTLTQDST
jgi:exodeoxyribonuclease VII small subunit